MVNKLIETLQHLKDTNPWFYYTWFKQLQFRGKRQLKKLSDRELINRLYFKKSGRYPDIDHPVLFSEKQQWLKLYYRNPLMPVCSDKYEVRDYLKQKGYGYLLNDLIAVFETADEIGVRKLPDQFVLKATHASGWNLICKDKKEINWWIWKKIMKNWLNHDIFWNGREWNYKDMKPRLVCEKFMEDKSGGLMDYKFYCFNGKPAFVQANNGRGQKVHAQNFYDLDWKLLPFGKDLIPIPEVEIPMPQKMQEMIDIAKDLSSPFPYVRVDFYEVNGQIIFGELTFFPASGMPDFVPTEYDRIVGEMLVLPEKNN
jgi:hypothetical protein